MLAVFDNSVAKCPDALQSPHSAPASSALKDGFLANHFASLHPGSVTVNLGTSGLISHSVEKQNPFLPRLFAVVDDIFCLFQGHIDNVAVLKQQYGLNKTANEVIVVIEAYRTGMYFECIWRQVFMYIGEPSNVGNVGCFFTTSGGLRSFEHPLNELKPVPRVDSSGQVCGATFKVDAETKKESVGMPRVDSSYNWSSNY